MTDHAIRFGTDGIRGVAGIAPLDPVSVLRTGRAIGRWATRTENPFVIVGTDTRVSGGMIGGALIAGLLAESIPVTHVGVLSTPAIAALTRARGAALGIVISASHNPVEQNGIKLFGPDGFKLSDTDERTIEALIETVSPFDAAPQPAGLTWADPTAEAEYLATFAGFAGALDGLTIVLDCSNGAGYHSGPAALRAAGTTVHAIKAEPNGVNINYNCGSEYVRRDRAPLLSAVQGYHADLGIALDGDADRCIVITPDGMLIDGDHIMGVLAVQMHAAGKLPGARVVATDMSNSGLEHYLTASGITLERTKVGDRHVMERMRAGGTVLGGEQAGHIIVLDGERTAGDGIYAALLIGALAAHSRRENGPTLAELARQIPRYPQVIANAHLHHTIDLATVPALGSLIKDTMAVFAGQGRVNIRFSGTEPNLLRAMVEGGPNNDLQEVVQRAAALCHCVADAAGTPSPEIDVIDCVTGAPVDLTPR